MKKAVVILLCAAMLACLAACGGTKQESPEGSGMPGGEVENSAVLENNISDTTDMILVETPIGRLCYPAKWADDVRFDVSEQQVTAFCGDVKLFALYFGGETGDLFGTLKLNDTETELRYEMFDLDASREDIDILSAMQDDINVIFQYLIQDGLLSKT